MWIDSDTMIINPTFQLPFNKFAGKDLIIWGNETALLAGDGRSGIMHRSELLYSLKMTTLEDYHRALPYGKSLELVLHLKVLMRVNNDCRRSAASQLLQFWQIWSQALSSTLTWLKNVFGAGMNSGVMLFRRTPWTEEFLEQVATLGRIPEPELGQVCKQHPLYPFSGGATGLPLC